MNKYKKYLIYLGSVLLIMLIVIYPTLFYAQLNVPTESSRYLDEWFSVKEKYATHIKGNKIVFISGSNTLFGINTARIEKETNIPTINFGTHAGLGLQYILERSKKIITPGDIVIMPLEYPMYEHKETFNEEFLDYIMAYDSEYFKEKNMTEKIKFIFSVNPLRIISGIKARFYADKKNIGGYDSTYLNQNGDMENNKIEKKKDDNYLVGLSSDKVFLNINYPSEESKKCLKEFFLYCQQNSVQVFITYPAFLFKEKNFSLNDLQKIQDIESFFSENDILVLGTYNEFLYDHSDFYDTIYHLNNIGKEKRTKQLISYLKLYVLANNEIGHEQR